MSINPLDIMRRWMKDKVRKNGDRNNKAESQSYDTPIASTQSETIQTRLSFEEAGTSKGPGEVSSSRPSNAVIKVQNSTEYLNSVGYQLGRVIGQGTYCKVKQVWFKNRIVAVKIITKAAVSQNFLKRYLPREIEVLRRVRHPNIINVYGVYEFPHRVYVFMELIKRGDLLMYIQETGAMRDSKARYFFSQCVDAVLYLHRLNIAHRDIKCENILITDADEVKLIDFGFSRFVLEIKGKRELSTTYCGSIAYVPPEVLQGIPYNPLVSDVWSLGCVLFVMVTAAMPFDDSNKHVMLVQQHRRPLKFLPESNASQQCEDMIRHMLEPDVTRRINMEQVSCCQWINQAQNTSKESHKETQV